MARGKITFDEFCNLICDGLYDPNFPLEDQCTGYKDLRKGQSKISDQHRKRR